MLKSCASLSSSRFRRFSVMKLIAGPYFRTSSQQQQQRRLATTMGWVQASLTVSLFLNHPRPAWAFVPRSSFVVVAASASSSSATASTTTTPTTKSVRSFASKMDQTFPTWSFDKPCASMEWSQLCPAALTVVLELNIFSEDNLTFHRMEGIHLSQRSNVTAHLIVVAFSFLLRVCEYAPSNRKYQKGAFSQAGHTALVSTLLSKYCSGRCHLGTSKNG